MLAPTRSPGSAPPASVDRGRAFLDPCHRGRADSGAGAVDALAELLHGLDPRAFGRALTAGEQVVRPEAGREPRLHVHGLQESFKVAQEDLPLAALLLVAGLTAPDGPVILIRHVRPKGLFLDDVTATTL